MKQWVKKATRPEVVGGLGGFAGLFDASKLTGYRRPLLAPDEYDVAGAATGVVEADALLGPERIREGDAVVALASSGLHSNGYSLVRHVLLNQAGWSLDRQVAEFGRTLGEELLEPTRIYALTCLELARRVEVHAFAHITGGGLAANLARVIPAGLHARLDRAGWRPAPVFELVGSVGSIAGEELERTLNMGVGMVAVVPAETADATVAALRELGQPAWLLGSIERGADPEQAGTAALTGAYAA
jgi:phosphoribosylformylglycinamidine cyclo-ligase